MFFATFALALAASTIVSAAPAADCKLAGCDISKATIDFPADHTGIVAPTGLPKHITLGLGIQNYSCVAGTWTSVGAVASLFDISCLYGRQQFETIQTDAFNALTTADFSDPDNAVSKLPGLRNVKSLIHHFFVPNPTALSPRFNLEPFQTTNSFTIDARAGSIASPQGTANIAWLQLSSVQGSLASAVYRVDTVKGQPPAGTCSSTTVLTVPYAAKYWFF